MEIEKIKSIKLIFEGLYSILRGFSKEFAKNVIGNGKKKKRNGPSCAY